MGFFITLEGPEGSGKSTQARLLADYLRDERGENVLLAREPGDTPIGDQVRQILHSHENQAMAPETELLLYNSARAQLVAQVIRPALEAGRIVLSDRYADSTLAYQGYGRGLDLGRVREILDFTTGGLKPDLTFLIDVTVEQGLARRKDGVQRGEEWNRMDSLSREFYERVRAGYLVLMQEEPDRWVRLDGAQDMQQVQIELRRHVDYALEEFHRIQSAGKTPSPETSLRRQP